MTGDARQPAATSVPGVDGDVTLPDGRRMAYRRFGAAGGAPVLALHGTPGSRLKFTVADDIARDLGLAIIAPDRWGYGRTDPHPQPTLTAFALDMRALADALGFARFAVMGVSGGGPYAAATAALAGARVNALALVAPVGPIAGETMHGISAFHQFCFGPFARSGLAPRVVFRGFRRLLKVSQTAGMRVAMARVGSADRRVLGAPGVRERLGACFVEGLRPGVEGPATDMLLFGRPWDVPLAAISARSALWIGDQDHNVPVAAAERLSRAIRGCELHPLPGEGHLWIALNYGAVLQWLRAAGAA